MSLEESINEGLADALQQMSPALCRDIDSVLAQGGTLRNIRSIVEKVRLEMGQQKALYTNTVEEMIEAYTCAALMRRKRNELAR